MKLAIIGGREFNDYSLLVNVMGQFFSGENKPHHIVSGGAKGADSLGARYAKENNIALTEYRPDWKTYGMRAGFLRNETIISDCDMVLAFWDGVSRGTGHSLSLAKKQKKDTIIIYF